MSDNMVSTRSVVGLVMLWCLATTACVPVPSDLGGSIPPPTIDGGGTAPPFGANQNLNGDSGAEEDTLVFAVSLFGHSSLLVDAIVIDAVLSVVQSTDVSGERSIVEATLQDTQNTFPIGDTGVVGGLFLTASRGAFGGFDLTGNADDGVVAVFEQGAGQTNGNRFVLSEGDQAFAPGDLGITYEVGGGSRFGFVIDGGQVTGTFNLNGFPFATFADDEVYEGTFSGTLR